MKKIWNHLKLKRKILLLFLPLNIISILLILILSVSLILNSGKNEMIRNASDKLLLVSEQTQRILENIKYNIKAFSTSSALQSAICAEYPDNTYGNYMFSSAMHSSVYNIMDIGSLVLSGYVQTYDGKVFNIKTDAVSSPTDEMNLVYDKITAANGRMILSPSINPSGESAFTISKSLIDIQTGRCLGILSFEIKESLFYDAYRSICEEQEDSVILTDSNGTIISAKNRSLLQTQMPEKEWKLLKSSRQTLAPLLWEEKQSLLLTTVTHTENIQVIYAAGYYHLLREAFSLAFLLVLTGIGILAVTIILSDFLAKSLVKPIIQLAGYADEAGKGNFDLPLVIQSDDEIGFLSLRFKYMSSNISQLTTRIYNEQNKKREYELKLLQAQINPHFLYNCLDNISSLITDKKNETASSMIFHLGRYYRGILSKGRNIITVREEMHMIRDYLEIQLIKSPQLFTYSIDTDEELKECKMLKMLLQPIVENCVIHGFSGYRANGHIRISAEKKDNIIMIQITDNGRGIQDSTLSSLFVPNDISIPKHFGLQNVHERIRLKFGSEYGLSIKSVPQTETTVTLFFPALL